MNGSGISKIGDQNLKIDSILEYLARAQRNYSYEKKKKKKKKSVQTLSVNRKREQSAGVVHENINLRE